MNGESCPGSRGQDDALWGFHANISQAYAALLQRAGQNGYLVGAVWI